jgi:hypothetical protein
MPLLLLALLSLPRHQCCAHFYSQARGGIACRRRHLVRHSGSDDGTGTSHGCMWSVRIVKDEEPDEKNGNGLND